MKMYKIEGTLQNLYDNFEDENLDLVEKLNEIKLERQEKITNITLMYKELAGFILAVENEINKLKEKKRIAENRLDNLKNYLSNYVLTPNEKIKTEQYTISWHKSESVEIDPSIDLTILANQYPDLFDIEINIKPKKLKIKEYIKNNNINPEGIKILEKNNLIIK